MSGQTKKNKREVVEQVRKAAKIIGCITELADMVEDVDKLEREHREAQKVLNEINEALGEQGKALEEVKDEYLKVGEGLLVKQEEALTIVGSAEVSAVALKREASEYAENIKREAVQQAEKTVSDMKSREQSLFATVDDLQKQVADLNGVIEERTDDLKNIKNAVVAEKQKAIDSISNL